MAIRSEDLAAANAKAMNMLDRQSDSLRNIMGVSNGGSTRGGAYYALEIVKALPHDRQLAIDALDRARAMVEAMHKAAS